MTSQRTSPEGKRSTSSKNNNPRKAKTKRWLWFTLGMGGIAMVSGMAGALLAVSWDSTPLQHSHLSATEASVFDGDRISGDGLKFSQLTRPVNILLLGMSVLPPDVKNPPPETKNLRYQVQLNSFEGLSDVMLLLRFDPKTKKIVILAIPRDTRIEIEKHGLKKINAANVYGGPALTAKTVSNLLDGVGIDRYVRINILGMGQLIDALGGVNVYVPRDMNYRDDSQHLYIHLKAGEQHLNGDQALQLLRFRHDALGDIGRIQRQQLVLRALINQALTPKTLTELPQILNTIKDHIDTNLTVEELVALFGFGVQTKHSNMQMLMVPGRFSNLKEFDASYWVPNQSGIDKLMSQYFSLGSIAQSHSGISKDPAQVRVAIQDSTGSNNAHLQTLVRMLEKSGYRNIFISRTWSQPLDVTHVVAQDGDTDSAALIRNSLGFGEVTVESTGNISSDVSVQVGKDWLRLVN